MNFQDEIGFGFVSDCYAGLDPVLSFASATTFRPSFRSATWHWAAASSLAGSIFLAFFYLCIMLSTPLREFLHRSCIIKQAQLHTAKQVFEIQYSFKAENTANSISRCSTFVQPIQSSLAIQLNCSRNSQG